MRGAQTKSTGGVKAPSPWAKGKAGGKSAGNPAGKMPKVVKQVPVPKVK